MNSESHRVLTLVVGILGMGIVLTLPSSASAEDQYVAVDVHCCGVTTNVKLPAKGMRGLGGAQIGLATVTCKAFLTEDTLQYAGWPQGEGKGRTINLRSVDRAPIQQEICRTLRAPDAVGSSAPGAAESSAPSGMVIPTCVRDALREVLASSRNELDLDVNFDKVRVFRGQQTSTGTAIYIDVPDAVWQNPCALPFALFVGMEVHKMRLRRRLEIGRRDFPAEVTEEDVARAVSPEVLDIYKGYLMKDLKYYYDQHGLNGELTCCQPLELPSPKPERAPVSCPEIESFCKPRIGMLLCPRP